MRVLSEFLSVLTKHLRGTIEGRKDLFGSQIQNFQSIMARRLWHNIVTLIWKQRDMLTVSSSVLLFHLSLYLLR